MHALAAQGGGSTLTMPRHPATLLRRLLADSVLPCAFAALVLTGLLTEQRIRDVNDTAHLQMTVQLERLAGALEHATDASTQVLIDRALLGGRDEPLKRIDLQEADGRRLSSGAPANAYFERYRQTLSSSSGAQRILTVHVDPAPRLHAQRLILLYGVLSGLGIAVLVVLATLTLRYRVSMPLRDLQRSIAAVKRRAWTQLNHMANSRSYAQVLPRWPDSRRRIAPTGRRSSERRRSMRWTSCTTARLRSVENCSSWHSLAIISASRCRHCS
jgi:hypothetical protein